MEIDIIRISFAFITGYFLSIAGSLSQLSTGNKMASPSTLGMDGLAVLTVILAQFILIGLEGSLNLEGYLYLERIAFIVFAISFTLIALTVLRKKTQLDNIWDISSSNKIIMIGLTFNLFIGAIFSVLLFMFMALNFEFPSGLWFGNFKQYNPNWLLLFLILFFVIFFQVARLSKKLAILNLGHNFTLGLGHDVRRIQNQAMLLSLLITGIVICHFGVFSFLGLILPHILRSFKSFSTNMSAELIWGGLISGVVLSVIDFACYQFTFEGAELPVGMVSGVLGSFFLIFLLLREKV